MFFFGEALSVRNSGVCIFTQGAQLHSNARFSAETVDLYLDFVNFKDEKAKLCTQFKCNTSKSQFLSCGSHMASAQQPRVTGGCRRVDGSGRARGWCRKNQGGCLQQLGSRHPEKSLG